MRSSIFRSLFHGGPGRARLTFLVLLTLLVLAVALAPGGVMRPLLDATAAATGWLLGIAGIDTDVQGNLVYLAGGTLLITRDCTGLYLMAIFTALVVSFPASLRSRLIALAWGLPTLLVLNMVRLVLAGMVLQWFPNAFSVIHDFIFQVLLVIAVLVLWLVWMNGLRGGHGRGAERAGATA